MKCRFWLLLALGVAVALAFTGFFTRSLETFKSCVDVVAVFAVLGFFVYRIAAGWLIPNLKITVGTQRVRSLRQPGVDCLVVKVTLDKGPTDGIRVHAVQLRIVPLPTGTPVLVPLNQFQRLQVDKNEASWSKEPDTRHMTLAAGDLMEFGELVDVQSGVPFRVEAVVVADRAWIRVSNRISQWRSSAVSLPLLETTTTS